MPGGQPPKSARRTVALYKEITLKEPVPPKKSWTWECNHCKNPFVWATPGRVEHHLAGTRSGGKVAACTAVDGATQNKFAELVGTKA